LGVELTLTLSQRDHGELAAGFARAVLPTQHVTTIDRQVACHNPKNNPPP
jgi:hypothetical protein